MRKKLLFALAAFGGVIAVLPLFAAFEAHVINVTARIENALSVPLEHLDFGTVFPQEFLERPFDIWLSESFLAEDRVDDVDYIIRQKPKCGVTTLDGRELIDGSTKTGHVIPDGNGGYTIDCGDAPVDFDSQTHTYGPLPLLCPYLSKHDGDPEDQNDGGLDAFHDPFTVSTTTVFWNDVRGHLAKSAQDLHDIWIVDLAVPCFGDHCAQDWEEFVEGINPDALPADQWVQPIENEHKIFGCDLWVEVGGISLPGGLGCNDEIDLMLVLDRSGSISDDELVTLKDAAKSFVDALSPSTDGSHIGQTSFSTSGTLDLHLSTSSAAIKAAIDAIDNGGNTNLAEGISLADTELDNPGDGHDRPDGSSPDFIVVITDGAPNEGGGEAGAEAAADAAKADGVTIFVVGVGTTGPTMEFLRDDIATSPDHYFDAADFDDLETILMELTECPNGEEPPPPPPPPPAPMTLLSDDFGTGDDLADIPGWDEHEAGTIAKAPTVSGEDTTSPNGGRFAKIAEDSGDAGTVDGWICRSVDATGKESLLLEYYWRGDADAESSDMGRAQYFTGGTCAAPTGGPVEIAAHDLSDDAAWTFNSVALPGVLDGTTFLLRFYNDSSADDEYFRVDAVEVTGVAI